MQDRSRGRKSDSGCSDSRGIGGGAAGCTGAAATSVDMQGKEFGNAIKVRFVIRVWHKTTGVLGLGHVLGEMKAPSQHELVIIACGRV